MLSFKELSIISPLLRALDEKHYNYPSSIQQKAIPAILTQKDVLGCAQTGTGKTAAFSIPILQLLQESSPVEKRRKIRALILTPTRELACQVAENIDAYGKYTNLQHTVIYGGVPQHKQVQCLQKGIDLLIATPGRLKDLINQGYIDLSYIEIFVLDEADRMLDMGFIEDIKLLIKKIPMNKQSIFFTATLSNEIKKLAGSILNNPIKIEVQDVTSKENNIEQSVYYVQRQNKKGLLMHLLESKSISDVLIFTKTKNGADRLSIDLNKLGIRTDSMHGGKSQNARQRALGDFKSKRNKVLVVTDVASRGIDINKLSYVINYDIPNNPETYVHRIGRTGRAGEKGTAISFCDSEELKDLKQINKMVPNVIEEITEHPFTFNIKSISLKSDATATHRPKKKINNWLRDRRINGHRNTSKKS